MGCGERVRGKREGSRARRSGALFIFYFYIFSLFFKWGSTSGDRKVDGGERVREEREERSKEERRSLLTAPLKLSVVKSVVKSAALFVIDFLLFFLIKKRLSFFAEKKFAAEAHFYSSMRTHIYEYEDTYIEV